MKEGNGTKIMLEASYCRIMRSIITLLILVVRFCDIVGRYQFTHLATHMWRNESASNFVKVKMKYASERRAPVPNTCINGFAEFAGAGNAAGDYSMRLASHARNSLADRN